MIYALLILFALTYALWVFFLAVMSLKRARDAGPQPPSGPDEKIVGIGPVFDGGKWVEGYNVVPMTTEEVAQRDAQQAEATRQNRAEAYRNESDPIFFKWQRGEATQEEWLTKVEEIKARFPDA